MSYLGQSPKKEKQLSEVKERHGCLTTWLVLMIISNTGIALIYLLGNGVISQNLPSAPGWVFPLLAMMGALNVVFAIALLKWKKWGFFGFIASSIMAFVVNLIIGINILQAIFGLASVGLLYVVLNIGKEKKAWTQLD